MAALDSQIVAEQRTNGSAGQTATTVDLPGQQRLGIDKDALARRVGLHLPAQLPYDRWQRVGRQLAVIADSSPWWLGDWLVYGETQYADRYKQALAQTSLDYQTLRNYAWVARSFPMSRRRDKLSFQHHAELVSLPPEQQDYWLDCAERHKWSRNELRRQLRASRRGAEPAPSLLTIRVDVGREREQRWREAAERTGCDFTAWVANTLDAAAEAALRGA